MRRSVVWHGAFAIALVVAAVASSANGQMLPVTAGMELWLDATDASTFTFSSGNLVSQWRDKSPNAHHASTAANFPALLSGVIGSQPAVNFQSTPLTITSGLPIASNQDRTAFLVMDYATQINNSEVFGTSTGNMVDVGKWDRPWRLRLRQSDNAFSAAHALPAGSHVVAIRGDTAGSHAWSDGPKIIETADKRFHWAMSSSNLQVGGANFAGRDYHGNVAELIIYDHALNEVEVQAVGQHLQEKYGIPGTYSAPPVVGGLELWLDASDPTSLTLDADGKVLEWRDKTGNAHHAAPLSGLPAPQLVPSALNAQPAIDFVQANRNVMGIAGDLGIASGDERTIFIAMSYDALLSNNEILGTSTSFMIDVGRYTPSGSQDERLRLRSHPDNAYSSAGDLPLGTNIITVQALSAGTLAFVDGKQVIDTTDLAQHYAMGTNLKIGGTNFNTRDYDGLLAEILIYDRALSSSERRAVEEYLYSKYVPEPASLSLLALGGLGLLTRRRKRLDGVRP